MPQYDDNMRGVLFRNDKKGSNEKAPDYKGNGEVNNVEVWISAWIKTSKQGTKYMSLSFENKEGQVVAQQTSELPVDTSDFETGNASFGADDDIPF